MIELKRHKNIEDAIKVLEDACKISENPRIMHLLANFILETSNYAKIAAVEAFRKYDSRSYAIAQALVAMDVASVEPLCLEGHEPMQDAAFVTMVKDEEDIILYNLVWHYTLGFRKYFIIDNLSTDKTIERIKLFESVFSDTEVFILHDPVVGYFQGQKMTGACRFAMSIWPEINWLALVDADEFLCVNQPLHALLAAVPEDADAIIVPKSVYSLVTGEAIDESDIFYRRMTHRTVVGHVSNKALMRARMDFNVRQGNHRIFGGDNQEVKNYSSYPNLTFREFPIRSLNHFRKKITNGGKAIAEAKQQGFNNVGGGHWELIYNLYLKEGEAGLSKKFAEILKRNTGEAIVQDGLPLSEVINRLNCARKAELLEVLIC